MKRNSTTPSIKKRTSKMMSTMEGRPIGKALGGRPIQIPTEEADSHFLIMIGEEEI